MTAAVTIALVGTSFSTSAAIASPLPTSEPVLSPVAEAEVLTELRGTTGQRINWKKCKITGTQRSQCARFAVPRDYAKPNGKQFKLKLYRLKALPKKQRGGKPVIGSVFANPGGPGASGVELLPGLSDLQKRLHVVTWAPRGVAASKPLLRNCPEDPNASFGSEYPLTGAFAWQEAAKAALKTRGPSKAFCYGSSPHLVPTIGTNNVVKDLDAMRAAVGDSKLTYLGFSYGTRIGRLYAQTYPNRVRAMVLDGVVDPTESMEDFAVLGAKGGKASFKYTKRALSTGELRAYRNVNKVLQSDYAPNFNRFIWWQMALNAGNSSSGLENLKVASCQVAQALSVPGCTGDDVRKRSVKATMRKLQRQLRKRTGPADLTSLINCVDLRGRPSPARVGQYLEGAVKTNLAGQVGRTNGLNYGATCLGLPEPADPVPALPQGVQLPTPPLLINGKGDALTPYIGAKQTHKRFSGSRLITVNTSHHALFRGKSQTSGCIVKPVLKYLKKQKLPKKNKYCKRTEK